MSNTALEIRQLKLIEETQPSGFALMKGMYPEQAALIFRVLNLTRANGNLAEQIERLALGNSDVNMAAMRAALCNIELQLASLYDILDLERDDILQQNIDNLTQLEPL